MEDNINEVVRKMNVARQVAAAIDVYRAFVDAKAGAFTHELLVNGRAEAKGCRTKTNTGGGTSNRIGPEVLRIA